LHAMGHGKGGDERTTSKIPSSGRALTVTYGCYKVRCAKSSSS
jgi:hypothetical protein